MPEKNKDVIYFVSSNFHHHLFMKSRLPPARRSEVFPILEGQTVLSSPSRIERALKTKTISEQDVIDRAVADFEIVFSNPNKIG